MGYVNDNFTDKQKNFVIHASAGIRLSGVGVGVDHSGTK
jgi:hypothetical protein